jgi:hypothetical protein
MQEAQQPSEVKAEVQAETPAAVSVKKKSGKGKWIACCLIIVILCCVCTSVTGYFAIFKMPDLIRFVARSEKDTTMTRYSADEVQKFDWDTYVAEHPVKTLANKSSEVELTEELFLKAMLNNPENRYMADYMGLDIKPGVMKIQIDLGSIMAVEAQKDPTSFTGLPFKPEDLKGTYVNIELNTSSDNKSIIFKSVRLGESPLDLNTLASDFLREIETKIKETDGYEAIEEIEFKDGKVRMVLKDTSFLENTK